MGEHVNYGGHDWTLTDEETELLRRLEAQQANDPLYQAEIALAAWDRETARIHDADESEAIMQAALRAFAKAAWTDEEGDGLDG